MKLLRTLGMVGMAALVAGCVVRSEAPIASVTDEGYLTASLWDDGRAEVAFYEVRRTENQYGEPDDQRFLVGTYLVKHPFSEAQMAKATQPAAGAVSSFKYALFYEFESGSYEYKRNWVTNARQHDLRPLKASFTSFDWCSNAYREYAFQADGTVATLYRSDDYGNAAATFDYPEAAFPPQQIPLLVRALAFAERSEVPFHVLLPDGETVAATAVLAGTETRATPDGPAEAERIVVRYGAPVPSVVGEESDPEEVYWRGTEPERLLLGWEGASGRYRVTLVEALRSAYWDEDLYPQLERVEARP